MDARTLKRRIERYETPSVRSSAIQLLDSFLPLLLLLVAMYWSLGVSYWLTLALAVPAAGFLIRVFIIQHDCGHGSFFRTSRANRRLGRLCSVITFVPYRYWQRYHALHHATSGQMDRRGEFDLPTLTVQEYAALSKVGKIKYRIIRHPLVLFALGPPLYFILVMRVPWIAPRDWKRERRSIILTDLTLLVVALAAWATIGIRAALLVYIPVVWIASAAGMWLFYVQHQFEETYWAATDTWDYGLAALQGSSFYRLPGWLQWFTGNIGLHHIHHLSTRIPNYRLQECYDQVPPMRDVPTLGLRESLRCARLKLWDEGERKLVGFEAAARLP